MKAKPILFSGEMVRALLDGRKTQTRRVVSQKHVPFIETISIEKWNKRPFPYGKIGNLLWVRETCTETHNAPHDFTYRADWGAEEDINRGICWTPSLYMPRRASRLTLEITGVRVERLQDISVADAIAEGLKAITKDGKTIKHGIPDCDGLPGTDNIGWEWSKWNIDPRLAYRQIWESINGAGSWYQNPWVWVIEFKVHKQNVDEFIKARTA